MGGFRRLAGFIAALLVLAMGIAFWAGGLPLAGIPLCVVGVGAAFWQAKYLKQTRPKPEDPYDLSRLWDYDPLDPVDEEPLDTSSDLVRTTSDANGTLYCQYCGHAVPDLFAFCPECGNRLG